MVIFRHDAGTAIYDVFLGFDATFTNPPVETTILAPALLGAWNASIIHLRREKMCRGGRR